MMGRCPMTMAKCALKGACKEEKHFERCLVYRFLMRREVNRNEADSTGNDEVKNLLARRG